MADLHRAAQARVPPGGGRGGGREPALRSPAPGRPRPAQTPHPPPLKGRGESPGGAGNQGGAGRRPPPPSRGGGGGGVGSDPKVTSADVLEALHRATGM